MDLKSQELFPVLTSKPTRPVAIWQKSNLPGLELATESSIERLDIPKENLIKKTLGPSISDICKSLMGRRKVSVELSSNKRTGTVTLIIHGSPADVLATKRELISQLTIPTVVTMNIPTVAKPFVIGKGGSTLKRITARSMTKIVIPKKNENESDSAEIIITGDDQGIKMAQDDIMEIVKKQISNYREKTNVEKFLHQFIGPHISALETEKNVKIHLSPRHHQDDEKKNEEIIISGEMDNVIAAVKKLNKIVDELVKSLGTIAVTLKKAQHRFIFGARGRGKQDIFEKTGCVVIIPDASDSSETVTIRGPEHMLSMGLQAVLEKANSVIIGKIDCQSIMPLSDCQVLLYLRYLFSREIQSIKEIQAQKSVNIYRQSGLPMVLEVHGRSKNELDEGMTELKNLISSHARSLYPKVVSIPNELHSYIIGKGGQNISKLKNLPQINGKLLDIILSSDTEKSNDVGVIVARAAYANAIESDEEAEKLISSIREILIEDATAAVNSLTEELFIDYRFHGRLIGSGGSMMKELLGPFQNSVKLTFSSSKSSNNSKEKANSSNDKIVIRGNMDGVKQVGQKIKTMVDQWQKVEQLTSFSHKVVANNEVMTEMFSGYTDLGGELDPSSFAWLVRDIRRKVTEVSSLQDEIKKDKFNIYSHRNYHLRLVCEPTGVLVFGPKLVVPYAVDIINSMVEKVSKTIVVEFSLFSESIPDGAIPSSEMYDRVLGRLIGKDGRNIKKLGEKHKVHVTFPKPKTEIEGVVEDHEASLGVVSLKGFKEDVDAIRKELLDLFAKELVFVIPKASVGSLLSLKDLSAKKLMSNYSVFMKINESVDSANVVLEGDKTNCETVKALILGRVDDMVNHLSLELRVPHYLLKYLIGPRGENIKQIIKSLNEHGKITIDVPRRSFSTLRSDVVTINCHKNIAHLVQSRIDELLSSFLFPERQEVVAISSLFSNGLETYIILSSKDFKRICGNDGEKLISLTRKYDAFVFIEEETPTSFTLRLVGTIKTASENLKQYFSEEMECTTYLDIPSIIYQNFESNRAEYFFFKNLISKLEKEFHAVFDIDSSSVKSGKVLVSCSVRNLAPLKMFFNSKMQKLADNSFISHIRIPKEAIGRIIGKGGESLKKIRQASSALVDIFSDLESSQEIAVLSGSSIDSIDVARLEIEKILKNFVAVKDEMKVEPQSDILIRTKFPPGYGDNFLKANLRYSNSRNGLSQMLNNLNHIPLLTEKNDAATPEGDNLDASQTSTLCESLNWKTIKGGKAVQEDPSPKLSKKKKKKKSSDKEHAHLEITTA